MKSSFRRAAALAALMTLLAPPARAIAPPVVNSPSAMEHALPFGPGESLRFSIEYGLIKAGSAWLEVAAMETYRGRSCYHFVSRAESNDFMSKIYKVRDRIDSLVDAEGLYSYRYRKHIREGDYKKNYDASYDPRAGKVKYSDGKIFDMTAYARDGLAAFYYMRFVPLEVGRDVVIPHHSDKASSDIVVKVHRKETVDVPAGRFACVVIEPVMSAGGLFKNSGRLTIWVTDDARRIPVLMKSKIPVGSIDAVLQEIKPGKAARASQAVPQATLPTAGS